MANTTIQFRIDTELKNQMEETCEKMGISISAAYLLFTKKVVDEQEIPFEITADPKATAQKRLLKYAEMLSKFQENKKDEE